LLLNDSTTGETTFLDDGVIIFKDDGNDYNYSINLNYNHTFDAGEGYKVVIEIKNTWEIEETIDSKLSITIFDRLGFRTKETSGSDWVNGNVPWFRKTLQTDMDDNAWGDKALGPGDGWILPYNLQSLNNTPYAYIADTVDENGFIPINYAGGAQIVYWNFYSDNNIVKPGWEIKITRVAVDTTTDGDAGSGSSVTCTGDGVYIITKNGSITCS
jgi:hypothetical protein